MRRGSEGTNAAEVTMVISAGDDFFALFGMLIVATLLAVVAIHCYFLARKRRLHSSEASHTALRRFPARKDKRRVTVIVSRGALSEYRLKIETSVIFEALRKSAHVECEVVECDARNLAKKIQRIVDDGKGISLWLHLVSHGSPSHIFREERGLRSPRVVAEANESFAALAEKYSRRNSRIHSGCYIDLVFANYCDSASLAKVLRAAEVPTVVGWQSACVEGAATWFAAAFYRSLALGASPIDAVATAKRALLYPVARGILLTCVGTTKNVTYRGDLRRVAEATTDAKTRYAAVALSDDGARGDSTLRSTLDELEDVKDDASEVINQQGTRVFRDALAPKFIFHDPEDTDIVDPLTGRAYIFRPDAPFIEVSSARGSLQRVESEEDVCVGTMTNRTDVSLQSRQTTQPIDVKEDTGDAGSTSAECPKEIVAFLDNILDDEDDSTFANRTTRSHDLHPSIPTPPRRLAADARGNWLAPRNNLQPLQPQSYSRMAPTATASLPNLFHNQYSPGTFDSRTPSAQLFPATTFRPVLLSNMHGAMHTRHFAIDPVIGAMSRRDSLSRTNNERIHSAHIRSAPVDPMLPFPRVQSESQQLLMLRSTQRHNPAYGEYVTYDVTARGDDCRGSNQPIFAGPLAVGVPVVHSDVFSDESRGCTSVISNKRPKSHIMLDHHTLPYLGKAKIARLARLGVNSVEDLAQVDTDDSMLAISATQNHRADHAKRTLRKW